VACVIREGRVYHECHPLYGKQMQVFKLAGRRMFVGTNTESTRIDSAPLAWGRARAGRRCPFTRDSFNRGSKEALLMCIAFMGLKHPNVPALKSPGGDSVAQKI